MWLDPDRFNCATCTAQDREILGHDKPAARPVPSEMPSDFYTGPDDPAHYRCPKLDVTAWCQAVFDTYWTAKQLSAAPANGGVLAWPAKLREALLHLDTQFALKRKRDADDAARKLPQFTGFTSR